MIVGEAGSVCSGQAGRWHKMCGLKSAQAAANAAAAMRRAPFGEVALQSGFCLSSWYVRVRERNTNAFVIRLSVGSRLMTT